ncbi:MAG: RNA methyltransferase [Paludibacteraceae bacterium]|nr:RNA methyltransferase [Paludibacteraceae bacterium]
MHFELIAKTFKGLEPVLANELRALGAGDIREQRRAVAFTGDMRMLYRANYCLRTASRVLVPIDTFQAHDADTVYEKAKHIDWSLFMSSDTSFTIDATVYSDTFRHSRYVTYRVKDAITDYWREKAGIRPSVQLTAPDLYINVHIADTQVTVSLDSSGESLHKRGYRVANTEAPISEALAAGLIMLTGWHGQSDFYDPMCGSGTLPIEAALIAQNIPPGIFRKQFAFERWHDFQKDIFEEITSDDSQEHDFTHHIYGSDAGYYAIQAAERNIKQAGVHKNISLRQIRIQELRDIHADKALVMLNPPYGERLAQNKDVLQLYADIGSCLKHQFQGATAWIISANEDALKHIGLKPSKRIPLLNGELPCHFNKYELFAGKRTERK